MTHLPPNISVDTDALRRPLPAVAPASRRSPLRYIALNSLILTIALLTLPMYPLARELRSIDDHYFARNVRYEFKGDQLVLVGRDAPTMTTVDDWGKLVFLAADGQHTVSQLIAHLGAQYGPRQPKELPEQVRAIIRDMVERGFVTVRPERTQLPYYLSLPVSQQDQERSRRQMESDGFIPKQPR